MQSIHCGHRARSYWPTRRSASVCTWRHQRGCGRPRRTPHIRCPQLKRAAASLGRRASLGSTTSTFHSERGDEASSVGSGRPWEITLRPPNSPPNSWPSLTLRRHMQRPCLRSNDPENQGVAAGVGTYRLRNCRRFRRCPHQAGSASGWRHSRAVIRQSRRHFGERRYMLHGNIEKVGVRWDRVRRRTA